MKETVSMQGRITIDNADQMRRRLANALRTHPALVAVDLSDVPYMDTSGLATLMEAMRTARQQGTRLVLSGIQQQPLPGMDQDEYMAHSDFDSRTLADLAAEFAHERAANVLMFRGLSEEAWLRRGTASGHEVTVRGSVVDLPPKEFALLEFLLRRPGRLSADSSLCFLGWKSRYIGSPGTTASTTSRALSTLNRAASPIWLRKKLEYGVFVS